MILTKRGRKKDNPQRKTQTNQKKKKKKKTKKKKGRKLKESTPLAHAPPEIKSRLEGEKKGGKRSTENPKKWPTLDFRRVASREKR